MMYPIINFYKFVAIHDVPALRAQQEQLASELDLLGSVLMATEGINAAISGSEEALKVYIERMQQDPRFQDVRFVWSQGETKPFRRFKVKVKDYIVVFHPDHEIAIDQIKEMSHIGPNEFEKGVLANSDDVVVLDTRNYYEVDYGTFKNAQHLELKNFRDFPSKFLERYGDQKDKTFLMFCTGGIRCEKASVFAKEAGFEKVHQLDGGILGYFQERGDKAFEGSCFVFDHRWAIDSEMNESDDGPHPDQLDRVPTVV